MLPWPALGQVISSWTGNNFNFSLSVTLMHASAPSQLLQASPPPPPLPCPDPVASLDNLTHTPGWPSEINNRLPVVWGPLACRVRRLRTPNGRSPDTLPVHHTTQWRIQSRFWPGRVPRTLSGLTNVGKSPGKTLPIKDIYVWSQHLLQLLLILCKLKVRVSSQAEVFNFHSTTWAGGQGGVTAQILMRNKSN